MFGKKKTKQSEEKGAVCQLCGLDCRDQFSLYSHIDWAHALGKSPVK